ncbi:MAG: type VI secretion system tip protein VgrG [Phycisphaeraceae bacterium]|nr:type VI secretion system tip protein VgrG [Phycisphaeraceae bacterium]MCW5762224.1 type VI secretion system tip protein VgrG [Phycisphaeraceae bacterium]
MHRKHGSRPVRVWTELAPDTVLLRRLSGTESISRPFEYELELRSDDRMLDVGALVGQIVSIEIDLPDGTVRPINGYVWACRREPDRGRTMCFRATVVPWLRLLEQSTDCRIFQAMTVPEIIKRVFRDHGFVDFRDELSDAYEARDYCVQYRESALAFVSRLMEDEGISYRFEHSGHKHELVLMDDTPACAPSPACPALPYIEPDAQHELDQRVWSWSVVSRLRPRNFAHTDYDFENPGKHLLTRARAPWSPPAATFEVYDYPGGYLNHEPGERYSSVRIEQLHHDQQEFRGRTSSRALEAGRRLTIDNDPFNVGAYVITRSELDLSLDEYESSGGARDPQMVVTSSIDAIEATRRFRPAISSSRPIVQGPQTAMVVGPADQEIYTDKHGRVKVQFHWDRYGQHDQESSCWIRSSQPWAGKGWGGIQIPRIGQEVIVDFLEGNPDRPIITGRVYNGASMPPVSNAGRDASKGETAPPNMKAAAMQLTLRSNSLGHSGGHNEITMHDEGEKEKLFIRAQKDEVHNVLNDRLDTVGNNETREVGVDRSRKVGNNELVVIGVNETRQVGENQQISVGQNIIIDAGTSITLKCGASTIHMNQAGFITISGVVVTMAGAVNCNVAAPLTNIAGAAMLTQTGALNISAGIVNRMEGGTLAHVGSGGMVEIEASGDAAVNGANVKLNC